MVIRKTLINIQNEANSIDGKEDLNPLDMLRPAHVRKTLILLLNWVTIVVGVYTLSLNATKLSGDLFLNYSLAVLAGSLPGTFALLLTLRFFGRRFNLFYTQFILGSYISYYSSIFYQLVIWQFYHNHFMQSNYRIYSYNFRSLLCCSCVSTKILQHCARCILSHRKMLLRCFFFGCVARNG